MLYIYIPSVRARTNGAVVVNLQHMRRGAAAPSDWILLFPDQCDHARISCKAVSSTLLKAIYHVSGRQGSYQLSRRTHYGVRGCTVTRLLALSPARCRTTHGGNTPSNVRMTTTEDSGRCPACRSPVRKISGRGNKKLFQRVAFERQPARELCFHWRDPGFLFSYVEIVIGMLRNHPAMTVLFLFGKKWGEKNGKTEMLRSSLKKSLCSFQAVNGFDSTDTDDDTGGSKCVLEM